MSGSKLIRLRCEVLQLGSAQPLLGPVPYPPPPPDREPRRNAAPPAGLEAPGHWVAGLLAESLPGPSEQKWVLDFQSEHPRPQ